MPKSIKAKQKKLTAEAREKDAKWWLRSKSAPWCAYVDHYVKRYGVNRSVAEEELIALGYYDEIEVERITAGGGQVEYRWCPFLDDLVPIAVTSHPVVSNNHPASPYAPGFDDEDIPF